MSLATRLAELITALGTDYKTIMASIAARPMIPRPVAGSYLMGWQILGTSNAIVTSGKATFHCIDVNNLSVDGIGVACGTASSGGAYTVTMAIYADNGRGNGPDLASGPIATTTVTATSTGNKYGSITPMTLHGRYWMAFLYYYTSLPTTEPRFNTINNAVQCTPGLIVGWAIGTVIRGYTLVSQTAMPTSGTLAGSATSDVVVCVLRSAA